MGLTWQYTQDGETPSMLMLEARDLCGGATGRNGMFSLFRYFSCAVGLEDRD